MKQGDIYWANLNPREGSEQRGRRPVVIISGNSLNTNLDICIICPLTTKLKYYPGAVSIKPNSTNNLGKEAQVITFQVRTISKKRFEKKIGTLKGDELSKIKKGLFEILTF